MKNQVTLEEVTNLTKRKVKIIILTSFSEIAKDGVDILTMNAEREPIDTESTLELILNTLCKAFQMKPK